MKLLNQIFGMAKPAPTPAPPAPPTLAAVESARERIATNDPGAVLPVKATTPAPQFVHVGYDVVTTTAKRGQVFSADQEAFIKELQAEYDRCEATMMDNTERRAREKYHQHVSALGNQVADGQPTPEGWALLDFIEEAATVRRAMQLKIREITAACAPISFAVADRVAALAAEAAQEVERQLAAVNAPYGRPMEPNRVLAELRFLAVSARQQCPVGGSTPPQKILEWCGITIQ